MRGEDLLHALGQEGDWASIEVVDSVDSTNLWARREALRGAPHLSAYLALSQGAGRGRLGRAWHSPMGQSLYLSVLIHLGDTPLEEAPKLTFAGALAVEDALLSLGLTTAAIKWPNDLGVQGEGGFRKLSGILAELLHQGAQGPQVILGIGVNLNQEPGDWPPELGSIATSLKSETGQGASPQGVGARVLQALKPWIDAVLRGEGDRVIDEVRSRCLTLGRRVGYSTPNGEILGVALTLGDEGDLIVRGDDGQQHRVTAGDVRIL